MHHLSWKPFALAALVVMALVSSVLPADARSQMSFESNGRSVRVEAFRAEGFGRKPAVMILHGASGLGDGTMLYPLARELNDRGINAYVVRYFDGLGAAQPAARPPAKGQRAQQVRGNPSAPSLHATRDRILQDALAFIANQPTVDSSRIGIFGLSLGGFHALDIASRDPRIQATVSFVGAMPAGGGDRALGQMPPTLLLHGTADRIVPFARVQSLHRQMVAAGAPVQMTTFPGAGHSFRASDLQRAHDTAADFLESALTTRGGRDTLVAFRPH